MSGDQLALGVGVARHTKPGASFRSRAWVVERR